MVRLYLFAEGQTEQTFADEVLAPHLAGYQVYLQGAILVANRRRHGLVHRGGGRHYLPMKNDIERLLKQERGADARFTTMIDLYALYSDFPGREAAERFRSNCWERVEALEQAFADDMDDPRFIPYLQLHEFEALLLADPECFACRFDGATKSIERLQSLVTEFDSPEQINDGQETAPSKRIIAEFPEYTELKRTDGPSLAGLIGLTSLRNKCPHFDYWLKRLEQLGFTASCQP